MSININRSARFSKRLQKEISCIIYKYIHDPRIRHIVTILDVIVSSDLYQAKVFVTFLGIEERKKINILLKILKNSSNFIKSHLGKCIYLRVIPNLLFIYDSSFIKGVELFKLISKKL